jgi:hypothetical protein
VGDYSLGFLSSDDRGPGKSVPDNSPLSGDRATFNIARVSRDLFKQSSLGAIYTDWELPGSNEFNRVGGLDSRLKFNPNWTGTFQAVVSSTQDFDGSYQAGPAYKADTTYDSTHLNFEGTYNDVSPGFLTQAGFVNRTDIREFRETLNYRFRPKSGPLLSWGPDLFTDHVWAHDGTRLDTFYDPDIAIQLKGQTYINYTPYIEFRERLRPSDFSTLLQDQDYHEHSSSISVGSSYLPKVNLQGYYSWGNSVNFVPAPSQQPFLAKSDSSQITISLLPITSLKIDNTYLFDRLRDPASGVAIFNNHIIRSKWNWQFNQELSMRVILQYTATLANPALTSLDSTKQFNADFLVTYLLHPGTAIYVGYNSDLQNLALDPVNGLHRTSRSYMNDSRQFFVKISYLFRF